jgi:uncharacterized protein with PIN domain
MKFIVDLTMGKLVKWLRIAGYDTVFYNSADVDRIIEIASKEGRIILTRNSSFIKRRKKTLEERGVQYLLLASEIVDMQLRDIAAHFMLNLKKNSFTICIDCNKPLTNISKADVAGKVPEYVYQNYSEFVQCNSCGKIFWGGTHKKRMDDRLAAILEN